MYINPQSSISTPPVLSTYVSVADLAKSGAPGTPRILTYQLETKILASEMLARSLTGYINPFASLYVVVVVYLVPTKSISTPNVENGK